MQNNFPVVLNDTPVPEKVNAHNGSATFILGVIEVISGVLLAIFLIAGIAISSKDTADTGSSVLLGVIGLICIASTAILGGAFSIGAGRTKSTCLILTTMVFGVLNALMIAPYVIVVGAILIGVGETLQYEEAEYGITTTSDVNASAMIGVGVLILIIGIAQLVVSITMSACACRGTCCCKPYPGAAQQGGNITMGQVAGAHIVQLGSQYATPGYGYDQPKI